MSPDVLWPVITTTAVATIYAIGGLLALAAAYRWRDGTGRVPALLLSWALWQHALNQVTALYPLHAAPGAPATLATWISLATSYFIAVPWTILIERMIGPGWKSTLRRTWQVYIIAGTASVIYDVATASPGASLHWNRVVVGAGAVVGFANLFMTRSLSGRKLLRVAILVFMALVIHDELAAAGWLPWRGNSGPVGVLICICAIGYTILSRTIRDQRELRTIELELATARRIQSAILPAVAPPLDGAALVFRYVPAAAVAGDMVDFLAATPRGVGILVADVSGHGVAAALIASMVKVAAAAQKACAADPSRVLAGIHLALADQLPAAHFVTACYVFVDLERGVMRQASAGHPPPLVWRAADRVFAPPAATGPLIMNVMPAVYPATETSLSPGDRVVMYTDGITEAMRSDDEMFGVARLQEAIAASGAGAHGVASAIMAAATAFTGAGGAGFEDDCTLVVLEMLS
jgi:sigma-B regulation protein RsbU (phosphoserine phosphatase)